MKIESKSRNFENLQRLCAFSRLWDLIFADPLRPGRSGCSGLFSWSCHCATLNGSISRQPLWWVSSNICFLKFRCSSKPRLKDSLWWCVTFPACEARSCKGAKCAHGCCEEACTLDKTYRCRMELRLEVHSNLRFVADVNDLLRSVGRARKNGSNRSDSVLIHLSSKTSIMCWDLRTNECHSDY